MRIELRIILIVSKLKYSQSNEELFNSLITQVKDWDYLVRLSIERQAGPFLYKKLLSINKDILVPENAMYALKQSWLKTLSRSMVLIDYFCNVSRAFQLAGIEVVALKGIYLTNWLYSEVGLRQFSDIDLLVKEEDGENTLAILRNLGFYETKSSAILPLIYKDNADTSHYPPMIKDGVSIEIHTRINNKYSKFKIDPQYLWLNTITVNLHGLNIKVFNIELLLISIIIHLNKHFQSGKFQFTGFYDIVNIIELKQDQINWYKFHDICNKNNLTEIAIKYLYLSSYFFDVDLPGNIKKSNFFYADEFDKKLFDECMLNGESNIRLDNAYIFNLKNIHSNIEKIKYIFYLVFPSANFMVGRYNIKYKWKLIYYYPFRIVSGLILGLKKKNNINKINSFPF